MPIIWLNNQFLDEENAGISPRDTGLLHAAGVFTTMRAYAGRVFRLDQHLSRLRRSCEALFVPLMHKDEQLRTAIAELLRKNGLRDARLRLTVTRGLAQQDPLHGLRLEPTTLLTASPLEPYPEEYYQRGLTVILADEQKLNPYDIQAGHKTLNYFSRLFSLRDANQRGAGEALLFNVHNYLQSGAISNVFMVKDGKLITPPTAEEMRDPGVSSSVPYPKSAVLPGITRQAVLELAQREKIEVRFSAIDVNQLLDADELFLTNSIMGIMPACRIERRIIGHDRPGALTRQLSELYEHFVRESLQH